MKITQEADYAIRIVLCLARGGGRTGARYLSENMAIPPRFTLKIIRKLIAPGIVKSYKGVNGGYVLNRPADEISLNDIIRAIDGELFINRCLEHGEVCGRSADKLICPVHENLLRINGLISTELEKVKISSLIEKENKNEEV